MGQKKWAAHMGHGMSHQCHQWPITNIWASASWDSPWATWHFALSCRRLSSSKMLPENGYLRCIEHMDLNWVGRRMDVAYLYLSQYHRWLLA